MSGFWVRWRDGIRKEAGNPVRQLDSQIIITWFVLVGLFAGALEMFVMKRSFFLSMVLASFGFLQFFGLRQLLEAKRNVKSAMEVMK